MDVRVVSLVLHGTLSQDVRVLFRNRLCTAPLEPSDRTERALACTSLKHFDLCLQRLVESMDGNKAFYSIYSNMAVLGDYFRVSARTVDFLHHLAAVRLARRALDHALELPLPEHLHILDDEAVGDSLASFSIAASQHEDAASLSVRVRTRKSKVEVKYDGDPGVLRVPHSAAATDEQLLVQLRDAVLARVGHVVRQVAQRARVHAATRDTYRALQPWLRVERGLTREVARTVEEVDAGAGAGAGASKRAASSGGASMALGALMVAAANQREPFVKDGLQGLPDGTLAELLRRARQRGLAALREPLPPFVPAAPVDA